MRKALIALLLVVIVGGGIALVVTSRPDLDEARDDTEAAWEPLVAPLNARYAALGVFVAQLDATLKASGEANIDLEQLGAALERWTRAAEGTDAETMVEAADDIEARVGQLRALVGASARLTQTPQVNAAEVAFDQAVPPPELVAAYNEAVRDYQRTRESTGKRLVAQTFGYGAIPTFEPSVAP